ncbi:hypothetical protein LR48_Vigan2559s000100 [Vigna angularis]|nr:hypothetical protein LR48_Vigan2559s000100 [Vigna angularis]
MESQKGKWRLRTSMDSSHIVEMNDLLRKPHVACINRTPFRRCLEIVSPLEVYFDWYVRKQDRGKPTIRVAFHLDEKLVAEGSRVEEEGNEMSDDDIWEAAVEERMRANNKKLRKLNAKIAPITQELCGVDEEVGGGADEEVGGGVDEEPANAFDEEVEGGADEETATAFDEEAAVEEAGGCAIKQVVIQVDEEPTFDEERVGGADEEVGGGVNEEAATAFDEEAKVEEAGGCAIERVVIQIDDDVVDHEGDGNDVPLSIPLLHHYVGDPSSTLDVNKLYYTVNLRYIPWSSLSQLYMMIIGGAMQ